jgi:hypothetical protein
MTCDATDHSNLSLNRSISVYVNIGLIVRRLAVGILTTRSGVTRTTRPSGSVANRTRGE